MIRIICDTMIWYYLSQGKLKVPDPEKYTLVCTYLSIMELTFTPNSFRKLGPVQKAIKQVIKLRAEFSSLPPFDHARSLVDKNFKEETEPVVDMAFAFLTRLLRHPKEGLKDGEFKQYLSMVSTRRKENNAEWAEFINELNEPMKEIRGIMKKYYSEELEQSVCRRWFLLQLQQVNDTPCSPDLVEWPLFSLYEKMYTYYNRKLMLSGMKADANDKNDLENMLYVQPSDLYWTCEKRWLIIAKEAKAENFLYIQ